MALLGSALGVEDVRPEIPALVALLKMLTPFLQEAFDGILFGSLVC